MRKEQRFSYFEALANQAGYAYEMALNLQSAIGKGELGQLGLVESLHTMENDADQVNHDIQGHLASDFVVPLERYGLNMLANSIDDVCDAIEDIALKAYMLNTSELGRAGSEMFTVMVQACEEFKAAIDALSGFKKEASGIREHLVRTQTCESDCDALYIEAVHRLYADAAMELEARRIAHAMLDAIEDAMDRFERAAELAEAVIAENL